MKTRILSWLLHHANREIKYYNSYKENFYEIKNLLLKKHGRLIGYDYQFIEGKTCWNCNGTGIYKYPVYDFSAKGYTKETCYSCYNGWYKRPVWNILALFKFRKYEFHQPNGKVYEKPESAVKIIEGYIEHSRSKYGSISLFFLFLVYEKGYLKRWWRSAGFGWRLYWWRPSNWLHNIIHLLKNGRHSIPVQDFIRKIKVKQYRHKLGQEHYMVFDDELPF